jgi:hypothetical protein
MITCELGVKTHELLVGHCFVIGVVTCWAETMRAHCLQGTDAIIHHCLGIFAVNLPLILLFFQVCRHY